jgi:hypothetical protein
LDLSWIIEIASGPAAASFAAFVFRKHRTLLLWRVSVLHAAICLGILTACLLFFGRLLWGGAVIALPAALADAPILLIFSQRTGSPSSGRFFLITIVAFIAPILALLAWSTLNARIMQWRATQIAEDRPFCIQASEGDGDATWYRAVTEWRQLYGFKMQAPFVEGSGFDPGITASFHAVLILGGKGPLTYYNWSYRAENFQLIDAYEAAETSVVCIPTANFFEGLR